MRIWGSLSLKKTISASDAPRSSSGLWLMGALSGLALLLTQGAQKQRCVWAPRIRRKNGGGRMEVSRKLEIQNHGFHDLR